MCNIAGYIGDESAAPILLKMTERQQGFADGYSTGIATICDGELHSAKVVGDVSTLKAETIAASLPGKIGIIHSRSRGGGGLSWAHPILDCEKRMAYLANGDIGLFQEEWNANRIAEDLVADGHTFDSRIGDSPAEFRADMPDGSYVHGSEVMCHFISSLVQKDSSPVEAIRAAYAAFPAEIAGLMLHLDAPDCVFASRINKALTVGRGNKGMYLATTAMAFPEGEISWFSAVPANATQAIFEDRIEVYPLHPQPQSIVDVIPWSAARDRVLELLASGKGQHFGKLKRVTSSLWPEGILPQDDVMIYEILRGLEDEGVIRFKERPIVSAEDGVSIPKKFAQLTSAATSR